MLMKGRVKRSYTLNRHARAFPASQPEQLFGRFMTAGRIDHVTRFPWADKRVQPSRAAPDAQPVSSSAPPMRREDPGEAGQRPVGNAGPCVGSSGRSSPGDVQFANVVSSSFTLLPCDNPSCLLKIVNNAWTWGPS